MFGRRVRRLPRSKGVYSRKLDRSSSQHPATTSNVAQGMTKLFTPAEFGA
jgi:hypothetical protein